jgi:PKD repeat protein
MNSIKWPERLKVIINRIPAHIFRTTMEKTIAIFFVSALIFLAFLSSCAKEKPEANFKISADTISMGDTLYFTNYSSGASYYQWSFGDGTNAITKDASHVYNQTGSFKVTLVSIGSNGSNTLSKNIFVTYKASIYEGLGIKEIGLGDTWATVNKNLSGNDTVHYVDSSGGYYYHLISYYNLGISIYFANSSISDVNDTDLAFEIIVSYPYAGYTKKGISIGSTIELVKSVYGTPAVYQGTGYNVNYYDSLGIEFWTSGTSSLVSEIAIYPAGSYPASSSQIKSIQSLSVPYHNTHSRLTGR